MAGRSLEPSAPSWLRYRDGVLCVRFAIVTRTSSQPLLFMHFCFVCIDALVTGIIKYYVAARSLVIFHSFIPFCSTQLFTSSLWAGPLTRSKPSQGQTLSLLSLLAELCSKRSATKTTFCFRLERKTYTADDSNHCWLLQLVNLPSLSRASFLAGVGQTQTIGS